MAKLISNVAGRRPFRAPLPGALLVALSGLGIAFYGVSTLIVRFGYWIEIGLTSFQIGGTAEQIERSDPRLFAYITHIQVASSGLLMAFGRTIVMLAWFGIRAGQKWALLKQHTALSPLC